MNAMQRANLAQWACDVQNWKESGLTQADWCQQNQININTFRYRMKRLNHLASEHEMPASIQFVPLTDCTVSQELPDTLPDETSLTVTFRNVTLEIKNPQVVHLQVILEVPSHA